MRQCLFLIMSGVVLSAWSEVTLIPNLLSSYFYKIIFTPIYIWSPQRTSERTGKILYSFYKWRNQGTEQLNVPLKTHSIGKW